MFSVEAISKTLRLQIYSIIFPKPLNATHNQFPKTVEGKQIWRNQGGRFFQINNNLLTEDEDSIEGILPALVLFF